MPRHLQVGDTAGGDLSGSYPNPSVVGGTGGGGGGSGTVYTVQLNGTDIDTAAAVLNFAGSGVSVTTVGHVVTITITGGGGTGHTGFGYLLENGSDYFGLEDGTGIYLLE